jgi:hypothetical protein
MVGHDETVHAALDASQTQFATSASVTKDTSAR